jgi:hypothetical protein
MSDDEIVFHTLMMEWNDDVKYLSGGYHKHQNFGKILQLKDSKDFNLTRSVWQYLEVMPSLIFPLLHQLVPDLPEIPSKMRGRYNAIIKLYKDFAIQKKYI